MNQQGALGSMCMQGRANTPCHPVEESREDNGSSRMDYMDAFPGPHIEDMQWLALG